MAVLQWPIARRTAGDVRGAALTLLPAILGYGAVLGMIYSPGT